MDKDLQSDLNEVYKELEEGDISMEDAMQRSNALTAEIASKRGAEEATQKITEIFQEREAAELQAKFLKDHPDFAELRDSGKLEPIKEGSGGMHDDFSAYFALKAEQGPEGLAVEETTEQIREPLPTRSEDEMEDSMLKAMEKSGE